MQRTLGVILVIGLVLLGIFTGIFNKKISSWFSQKPEQPPEPLILSESPEPRSTLNDGIPDWQKILVGLNPADPTSTVAFAERKTTLEQEGIWNNIHTVPTDDQLGIEIGNQLIVNQNLNDQTIYQETAGTTLEYITQLDASLKKYTRVDIEENPISDHEAEVEYLAKLEQISKKLNTIETNQELIQNYFEGTIPKSELNEVSGGIAQFIQELLLLPVPSGLQTLHLELINTTYTLHQILDSFETIDPADDVKKFATITLFQDKLNRLGRLWLSINTYFILGSEE